MFILSTSSLTDIPLVRLSEIIISSCCVRPISKIKRWFIRWRLVEKNESVGLYTPRSLICKPKIYTKFTQRPKRKEIMNRGCEDLAALCVMSSQVETSLDLFGKHPKIPLLLGMTARGYE